jgi:hypothetical protein
MYKKGRATSSLKSQQYKRFPRGKHLKGINTSQSLTPMMEAIRRGIAEYPSMSKAIRFGPIKTKSAIQHVPTNFIFDPYSGHYLGHIRDKEIIESYENS